MDKTHFPTNDLVEIVFDDPTEFDTSRDDIDEPIECRTIGWVEKFDNSSVRISWLKELEDHPYVGLTIPIGCIKKIGTFESKLKVQYERRKK